MVNNNIRSSSPRLSDDDHDEERPKKRRKVSPEPVASHGPTVQQLLLEEIDLEVAIRQRIANTVQSRITWALLLQQSLQKSTTFRLDDFRSASLEALDAVEAPCDLIYDRESRLASQPIRPPAAAANPATAQVAPTATLPLASTSRSTRTRGLPRAAPAPRERLLFIRNTATDPPEVAKLACPVCSRSDFSSLQGLLNHCRLRHQIEYGSHDECMQSCAVLVPDEERDWVVAAGIEVGGVSLPSLRRLFEIAVGAGDKVILPTKKPSPAPTLTSAQATAESPSRPAETKAEPTEEKLQESAHVTKTLGYHIDTPALAPFLGRAPKKRCIHVRADEDEPVDIEDTSLGSGLQARRIWRKPYAHRNIARKELDEIIPPDEVSTDDRADQPAHAIQADGRREGSVSRNSPALQMLSGTRFHINARVQVADYSLFLPPNRRPAQYPDHTHRWRLVATSPSYSLPIASILRKFTVTCVTDPPPPTVAEPITILEPPFVVTSTTDKPFLARLTFTWAGSLNPPTEIEHWVDLDPMHYANPALGDEQVFDVELDRSTELLPVPPDLREHNPQDMLTAETSVTAEPDKAAEVEEVVPEPDYSVKLRSLLPQFPMTQKDIKGRFSARLPYSLANNPAQLRNMCYGRRKAIEMARARALRDAYSQLISEQQDTEAVPLTTLDVYHWLEDEGFYPRSGVNGAKQDSQKSEAAKSSRRQRGPGALSGDAFCRTCGLHRAYHPNVVDEDVKPVDIKPSALGAALERGLCMAFNGEDGAPTRRPIFDVDALLKFAPTDSEIDAAQEVPYGLSRAIFVAPTSSSPGADMSSSLTDLVSVADPMLVVAIQRITGLPRLGNEAVEDRSEESAAPFMLTTLPRSEAAAELAPSALLAIALKEFVRHLVGRGIDALRQDEAALRVATGRHDRARRPPAAGGAIPPRRLLTPSHVLRGMARYARTGLTGSALRVCLGRLGERCAILDDDPGDGAIHIPPGLATIQGVEEGRGDGDVPGEKDGALLHGPGLVLPDGMVVKAEGG
ncbi:hypothetical protein PYCCODRAFT_1399215 [Trametes coccinea BRFM310]|uniref:YEATS domain-containing protein n=1 Tax=Trametes coccinea (strain BRFM310) TaxID=1353009 RepID=A0A1Y2IBE6_TRAC3|nr:hypothetical protein PYCCODRAFT_1399215 [Trametes coccinea BRFM310]